MIPMLDLKREMNLIGEEIDKAVKSSLKETRFILGPNVESFEKEVAEYLGVKYAVGVGSGTEALHLALRALGVGEGDEVITVPFTFIATAEAILYCNAKPVFVDVDEETMNIDVTQLENKITEKTKVIIPVHLFGNPANLDEVIEVAKKYNIKVLDDCAQSFGAEYKGKKIGSICDVSAFSFFPSKNLGCYGDGGLITTDDESVYNTLKALRNHGSFTRYYHEMLGFNSRLDDIQAAILRVKLKYIDKLNNDRIRIANLYRDRLSDFVKIQAENDNGQHVYHQFTIVSEKRDLIQKRLQEHEIASAIYYPIPVHLQKSFSKLGYKKGDFPVSEKLAEKVVSLPMNPFLEDEEVEIISSVVKNAVNE
ncbi:aminotransferase, DegT/DnrJ/EryC1/StrS family [Deferribacter desulfuricans SSM1]|uniref:Aminotransferase, DegT/DnrJ/EryC1/StrS family n=1 Tax=Deferribacter desulfuricans (strain DSM 14783 / JCM 11476 / NBRC 101012 / SSM1) TaxID=639282 RepID=D3PAM3_DEFDS|nr:DegT/DnrJ/EryC1/StrS family aminotransferase [Deferribacter desulfuricans]BAI79646.1 aminotransferase, DegT/DnrJ/EryC1/StrS family [Deferribacter desulfuricans SSM1]